MPSPLRAILLITLGFSAVPAPAQMAPPPQQPAPAAPPAGRIAGTVICSDTHLPARGALVMIERVPPADAGPSTGRAEGMARTGMDGAYTVNNVAPGEYSVTAAFPGYLSPADELFHTLKESPAELRKRLEKDGTVNVQANTTATQDLSLDRGATVSGRVLYSDGSPAQGISIELQNADAKPSARPGEDEAAAMAFSRALLTHQSQVTDDAGDFRVAGVHPGHFRIAAVLSVAAPSDFANPSFALLVGPSASSAAMRVYGGDTLHRKAAKVYELQAGDDLTGIQITLPLGAFHQVRGVLQAQDGRPINLATLTLKDTTDDSISFSTKVGEDGSFIFPNVPDGTYTLSSADARIVQVADSRLPFRFATKHVIDAFGNGSTPVIVKDSDVDDISLSLAEAPIPPNADKTANSGAFLMTQ